MKLRLSGTREECAAAVDALTVGFTVHEVSAFHPNRGTSMFGRVYIDADPAPAPAARVRATATRTDHARPGLPGGPASSLDRTGGPW